MLSPPPAAIPPPSSAIASETLAVPLRQLDPDRAAAVLERVLEELAEDERERGRAVAGERDRLERRLDVLPDDEALHEHRPQPLDQLGEVDVVLAVLGQHLVHGRDREDPVDRVVSAGAGRPPARAPGAAAARRRSAGCS